MHIIAQKIQGHALKCYFFLNIAQRITFETLENKDDMNFNILYFTINSVCYRYVTGTVCFTYLAKFYNTWSVPKQGRACASMAEILPTSMTENLHYEAF